MSGEIIRCGQCDKRRYVEEEFTVWNRLEWWNSEKYKRFCSAECRDAYIKRNTDND